jgi:hypothetical protein
MNERAMIEKHLAQAEEHIRTGQGHITRQKEILAELERDGHEGSAQQARERNFRTDAEVPFGDRDRLRAELAAMD